MNISITDEFAAGEKFIVCDGRCEDESDASGVALRLISIPNLKWLLKKKKKKIKTIK